MERRLQSVDEPQLYEVETDAIRFRLATACPYYSTIIYRLTTKKVEGLRTFGVSAGWTWYYGDLVPFDKDEQVAVLFHEINHLLRSHHERQGDRHDEQWNYAGDLEINDWFPASMKVPENIIVPSDFKLPDGELAEFYYHNLPIMEYHVRQDATPMDPGTGPCASHPSCDSKDVEPKPGNGKDKQPVKGKLHGPACGGAAGNPGPNEPESQNEGGGKENAPVVSPIEAESIRRDIARNVSEEAQKNRGNMPAGLVRWADELLNPKIRWEKLLRTRARKAAIMIAGHTDQTWTKPSRRRIPPFILPKRISRKAVPAFYIDTSGSMSQDEIQAGLSEVKGAVRANASMMWVTFLDAKVYDSVKISTASQIKLLKPKGGGGTDMRLAFEHYKTLNPRPNLIIVFTDGYTPWPEEAPGIKTIIIVKGNGEDGPDWAETIRISDD
jgi:predicted metal-dependent peptidase